MCGFVGIVGDRNVAARIHLGLQAIQHRGQDAAGLATMTADGEHFMVERGLGTATTAISNDAVDALTGPLGIGHVRYPTIGRGTLQDTQPFFLPAARCHHGPQRQHHELR